MDAILSQGTKPAKPEYNVEYYSLRKSVVLKKNTTSSYGRKGSWRKKLLERSPVRSE